MARTSRFVWLLAIACCGLHFTVHASDAPAATAPAVDLPLYAVQVRVGDKWDASKPPQEQALFREHSANLKRLRDAGHLVMGARFSDVGLIVLAAESEAQARAMMDADPSIAAGTFRYEVHAFNVFYPGTVRSPARPKPQS